MAYGYACHLWVLGAPEPSTLKGWLVAAIPEVREGDLEVWRLGQRLLVGAVNTSDREARLRSMRTVEALAAAVKGFDWVRLELFPDSGFWSLERSAEPALSWDADDEEGDPPIALLQQAKEVVRALVPLELAELHHYVDWAHALEATVPGEPAPALRVPVERVSLGLPAAPPAPAAARAGSFLVEHWLAACCALASAFTVSVVQAPGPAAASARFSHFLWESFSLWLLGVVLLGVTSNGWPSARTCGASAVLMVAAGAAWSLVPV